MAGVFTTEGNARLQAEYAAGTPSTYVSHKLHLATADPGIGAPASEVSGGSYAAQTLTMGTAASKSIANSAVVTFTSMPAVTVTHGWIDGTTAAPVTNNEISFALSSSVVVSAGQSISFAIGALTVAVSP